jgi:hypothetical protein
MWGSLGVLLWWVWKRLAVLRRRMRGRGQRWRSRLLVASRNSLVLVFWTYRAYGTPDLIGIGLEPLTKSLNVRPKRLRYRGGRIGVITQLPLRNMLRLRAWLLPIVLRSIVIPGSWLILILMLGWKRRERRRLLHAAMMGLLRGLGNRSGLLVWFWWFRRW